MLGHAQSVVDRTVSRPGVEAGCAAHLGCGYPRDRLRGLRGVLRPRDERTPLHEVLLLAAFCDEFGIEQSLGDDHVGQRRRQRHIGTRSQFQVELRLDVRGVDEVDGARIDDDEAGAFPQALLQS